MASRRRSFTPRPLRTCRVSLAHARQSSFGSFLSAKTFFFANGRRLDGWRRGGSTWAWFSGCRAPAIPFGTEIWPARQILMFLFWVAVESNGAILKEQETRHQHGAAFDTVLSLLPLESR